MSTNLKIAVVEDNEWFNRFLVHVIGMIQEYEVKGFFSGKELIEGIQHFSPDIVTIDYRLPDTTGDILMKEVKSIFPATDVVIISEQDDIEVAIELMRKGASDYLVKSKDMKELLFKTLKNIDEKRSLKTEIVELKKEVQTKNEFSKQLIGNSPLLKSVIQLLEKAVKTNISVVINGETGTGKEVVAKGIHYSSGRKDQKFVAINMAAVPSELMESELFGFEKGAFTNALSRRIGKFEEASGGTLFLDEIGELDMALQAKLLRALQEKEITRLGSNESVKVDCRIVVATHRNLLEEVQKGNFREDLYYRLFGLNVNLPPLRERGNDILILARHFIQLFAKENGMDALELSEKAQQKLLNYSWPGNVRELKSIMDLSMVLCEGQHILPEHVVLQENQSFQTLLQKEMSLREYNLKILQFFLDKYNNDVTKVAKKLDLGRTTIYRMLKEVE
ncbi:MAG: sigma-54 dependent transcriptional regulator [Crocinitomicaceae bacterium]